MVDRLEKGEPPLPGFHAAPIDLKSEHILERAFETHFARYLPRSSSEQDPGSEARSWLPPPRSSVIDRMLAALLHLVRGTSWECAFWSYLLPKVPSLIPADLVDDLISRDIQVVLLAHLPLRDASLWKLVDIEEALFTLALRRFTSSEYDSAEFEEVVSTDPENKRLLRALAACEPDHPAKRRILAGYIALSTDRDELYQRASIELREEVDRL